MDLIDKVVYINLDYRTDRRKSIEETLACFPSEKVIRFPAIRDKVGALGASCSHTAVLELAYQNQWKNVLIMEDDMIWKTKDTLPILEDLMKKKFDVIVLGGILVHHNPETHKLHKCNSMGAYLVSQQYYPILLQNFRESLRDFSLFVKPRRIWEKRKGRHNPIDIHWHILQARDTWFILSMFHALEGHSDTLNRVYDYSALYL